MPSLFSCIYGQVRLEFMVAFFCSLNPICTLIDLVHARRVSFFAIATPLPLVESARDRIQATSNQEKQ